MMSNTTSDEQRLLELLSDRALFGLSSDEEHELAALQGQFPDVDDNEMDRIVALLESSAPEDQNDSIPAAVQEKVLLNSRRDLSSGPSPTVQAPKKVRSSRRDVMIAVLASAATLLFALLALWRPDVTGPKLSMAQRRASLVASAKDLTQVKFSPTTPAAAISGDVVWSSQAQQGYMRFSGLPVNNPAETQYQLWIFDANQDDRYPIDGGVFDVTGPQVVVPIDAKIRVNDPAMFAITVEKPGGVVVSDRSKLPLLGKVE